MCYDISFKVVINQLSDYFPDLIFDDQIKINFDAAVHILGHDYGVHPIIYENREDGKLHCKSMEWGCIPYYITNEDFYKKSRPGMLNARSERILEDTESYWYKIRNRRCLIPMTGIYEHREVKGWKKKVPYLVGLKEQPVFFIPGLYSVAELGDKETGEVTKRWTFTLITRSANDVMKMIHNGGENKWRMPLFLPLELSHKWVRNNLSLEEYKTILGFEMPSDALNYYTVDTIRSSKMRADGKAKDELFVWDKLPELSLE